MNVKKKKKKPMTSKITKGSEESVEGSGDAGVSNVHRAWRGAGELHRVSAVLVRMPYFAIFSKCLCNLFVCCAPLDVEHFACTTVTPPLL